MPPPALVAAAHRCGRPQVDGRCFHGADDVDGASLQTQIWVADSTAAELSALVGRYPLDERFRSLFMIALCMGNRRADAILTYHAAREILRDELGIDVGAELRATYMRILNGDIFSSVPGGTPGRNG